jgi:hypothetical protein
MRLRRFSDRPANPAAASNRLYSSLERAIKPKKLRSGSGSIVWLPFATTELTGDFNAPVLRGHCKPTADKIDWDVDDHRNAHADQY